MSKVLNSEGKQAIHVRVGINSGEVVSGVVGRKKQQFSLFGDCVNTASRMQSCAERDEVRVSPKTVQYLRDEFSTKHRQQYVKVSCEKAVCSLPRNLVLSLPASPPSLPPSLPPPPSFF